MSRVTVKIQHLMETEETALELVKSMTRRQALEMYRKGGYARRIAEARFGREELRRSVRKRTAGRQSSHGLRLKEDDADGKTAKGRKVRIGRRVTPDPKMTMPFRLSDETVAILSMNRPNDRLAPDAIDHEAVLMDGLFGSLAGGVASHGIGYGTVDGMTASAAGHYRSSGK